MTTLTVGLGGTYSTIQAAIDAAADGDTIMIAAGTYREQMTIDGKTITLQGAGSGQTIIESPDAASVVTNASDSNSGPADPLRGDHRQGRRRRHDRRRDRRWPRPGKHSESADQLRLYGYLRAQFRRRYRRRRHEGCRRAGRRRRLSGNQRNHAIVATGHDAAHGGPATTHGRDRQFGPISNFQKTGIFANGSSLTTTIDNNDHHRHPDRHPDAERHPGRVGCSALRRRRRPHRQHATASTTTPSPTSTNSGTPERNRHHRLQRRRHIVSITNNTVSGWRRPAAAPTAQQRHHLSSIPTAAPSRQYDLTGFDAGRSTCLTHFGGALHTPVSHSGNTYNTDVINITLEPIPPARRRLTFAGRKGTTS